MLCVCGHYKYFNSFSVGAVYISQILTYENAQQTRDIELMLGQCWPAVYDVGPTIDPTLVQYLVFAGPPLH